MKDFVLTLDRNAEIQIQARIKITTDPPHAAGGAVTLSATCGGFTSTHTGATNIMYTLPADKQVALQVAYVDKNGNPATVDGEVSWETSDVDVASIAPIDPPEGGAPGSAVMLTPGTKVGNCQITANADADLGEGVRELVTMLDVTVVGGEAVAGTITPIGEQTPVPESAKTRK